MQNEHERRYTLWHVLWEYLVVDYGAATICGYSLLWQFLTRLKMMISPISHCETGNHTTWTVAWY